MKISCISFVTAVCLLGQAVSLRATEQAVPVTPQALTGWSITGAPSAALSSLPALVLPPGAQLSRPFTSTRLSVHLVTQPVFGVDATAWPVVEIGSSAIVFARIGDAGRLVLVIGDSDPLPLPWPIALDATGRSLAPLDLKFGRDGEKLTVSNSVSTLQFSAGPAGASGLSVIVSAGNTAAWSLAELVVVVSVPDNLSAATGGQNSARPAGSPLASDRQAPRQDAAPIPLGTAAPAASTEAGTTKPAASTASTPAVSTLEVFTPPSVRHGRADAVRAIVAKPQGS